MSALFPINNTAYWHVEHANQGHYVANSLVLASDANIYYLTGTATTDPALAGQTDWALFGGSSLALAAAGNTTSTTDAISPAAVVALIDAYNAAALEVAAIPGVAGGVATDAQTALADIGAQLATLKSVTGQHLGQVSTVAALNALTDPDGTTAIEAGDWAILDADDSGQAAGIYIHNGTAFPTTPAYQFPDVYAQRAPELLTLTTGTATYALASAPSAADLDRVTVSVTGSAGLTRDDWSVTGANLTFSVPTAALIQTGMKAQVTY